MHSTYADDDCGELMSRDLSTIARTQVEAQFSSEVWLWFATITHDDLPDPIRVVCEGLGSISYKNGGIVNYQLNGDLYLACPFKLEWISDDGTAPKAKVTVPDVDRSIGVEVLLLTDSPQIGFQLCKLSDWLTTFGSNNERLHSGTITPEVSADFFFLRNVSGDAMQVTADLTTYDISVEPWPKYRATQDRLPWIAR